MANILKNPSYKANLGYSGFDMSQKLKFSSTVGELLPIYYDLLQPGDKVTISTELKTRTMPLDAAAMTSISEHIDWFFVPLEQIFSPFGSLFYGINDLRSSLIDLNNLILNMPFFNRENFSAGLESIVHPWNAEEPTNYHKDIYGLENTSLRLFEMLGISAEKLYNFAYDQIEDPQNTYSISLPLMPAFFSAYQKIYWDCYANKDRQQCDPKYWSLDKYYNISSIPAADLWNFVELRYRPFERDFFTNTYISPVFASGSINSVGTHVNDGESGVENMFRQWLTTYAPVISSPDGNVVHDAEDGTVVAGNASASGSLLNRQARQILNPTAIRTSFAIQKLLEVTRRAGKHVDAQQLAHFGVDMPTGISGEVVRVGNFVSGIRIGDVIATATTDDSVLGQVGGKGYGYGKSGEIKYSASCHGILMGIYSASVDRNYLPAYDRLHSYIYMADFPHPEFDNLGMQPLFKYQSNWYISSETENADFYNWQYRWSELKKKYNRATGALASSLSYWTTTSRFIGDTLANGFLQSPFALNDIMLTPYTTLPSYGSAKYAGLWMQDPLIHELYVDCKKASKMSTYGLEQL